MNKLKAKLLRLKEENAKGFPNIVMLIDIFIVLDMSLTKIAELCDIDRSLPYSWLKNKSKPSVATIIKLAILVGTKTKNEIDDISKLFKTPSWWIVQILRSSGQSFSEEKIKQILLSSGTETLAGQANLIVSAIEKRKLLQSITNSDDVCYIEGYPDVADRIIASRLMFRDESSWYKTNQGELMYFFGGNSVSTEELYKWVQSLIEQTLNTEQVMTVFVAPLHALSQDEFGLLNDLYQFWLGRLPESVKSRLKVYLSSVASSCPVALSVFTSFKNQTKYMELHGLESAIKVLAPLCITKESKKNIYHEVYSLTTLRTDMNEATAKLLLRENGVQYSDNNLRFVPTINTWNLVDV